MQVQLNSRHYDRGDFVSSPARLWGWLPFPSTLQGLPMFPVVPLRTVYCTSCSKSFDLACSLVEVGLQSGHVVLSGHPSGYGERLYGVCGSCSKQVQRVPRGLAAEDRARRFKAWELMEWDLSLSREQAIRAVVEEEFDVRWEPDAGFRAYLLERYPRVS